MGKHIRVFYIIYVCVLVAIVSGFLYLNARTKNVDTLVIAQSAEDVSSLEEKDAYVTLTRSKGWLETSTIHANQYDGTIYNTTGHQLKDWSVKIELPFEASINDYWSMEFGQNDREVVIVGLDYNTVIEPGDCLTFGFIMYSSYDAEFNDFVIQATPVYKITDFKLFYVLLVAGLLWLIAIISTLAVTFNTFRYNRRRTRDQLIIVQSMKTFTNCIDAKDPYTRGHSARVGYYSKMLARAMGFDEETVSNVYYVALMHDVGKISIKDDILLKPGKLTFDERAEIEKHTVNGGTILKDFTAIDSIVDGAMYHHERYDGKGYPTGLKGDEIPLIGRIIAVADAYDAMSSDRCYRDALPYSTIIEELRNNAGGQFDPTIVEYMLKMIENGAFANMEEEV